MNPPPTPFPVAKQESSGLAVASLILGILGIVLCLGPLAGIPAVICGHMAHSRIKRFGGTGSGMAIGGLITGYISIAMIALIGVMAAIAIPNFVKARDQALYHACQNHLRTIQSAKEAWATENRKTADAVPERADLLRGQLISESLKCPAGGTYQFNAVNEDPSCTKHGGLGSR
jgi:hypothetical protein